MNYIDNDGAVLSIPATTRTGNNLRKVTHKSQPDDLPLRSGVIGAGGAVDIQRPTAAPLPVLENP